MTPDPRAAPDRLDALQLVLKADALPVLLCAPGHWRNGHVAILARLLLEERLRLIPEPARTLAEVAEHLQRRWPELAALARRTTL